MVRSESLGSASEHFLLVRSGTIGVAQGVQHHGQFAACSKGIRVVEAKRLRMPFESLLQKGSSSVEVPYAAKREC